ncbi:MAG TPA: hypothetical protein VMB48_11400, partial [Steroidobacteraceae bacterium]|nr:hypothetical protein [Steroidobacteraceae bacterium]
GGCQVPLGALATLAGAALRVHAVVCAPDGSASLAVEDETALAGAEALRQAAALGVRAADALLARGAADLIARARTPAPVPRP